MHETEKHKGKSGFAEGLSAGLLAAESGQQLAETNICYQATGFVPLQIQQLAETFDWQNFCCWAISNGVFPEAT